MKISIKQEQTLELVKKILFGNFEIEFYKDVSKDDTNLFMTRKQIAKALNYNSESSFNKVVERNKDIIGLSLIHKILSTDGKFYNTQLYNLEQIFKICSFTRQSKTQDLINGLSLLTGFKPIKVNSRYELDFEKILFLYVS